jgi:MFS family permease
LVLAQEPANMGLFRTMGYLLRIPTYTLLIIASSLAYYVFGGIRGFGMIYFTQHYGISRSTLGWLIIPVGVAGIVGGIASGRISEWLLRRGWATIRITLPGVALFATVLLLGGAIWVTNVWFGLALFIAGAFALTAANPPIDAARLDIVLPGMWGRGEAGRMALRGLLEGGAPLVVGVVSIWLGGGSEGLMWALLLMLIPLLIASLLAIPLRRTYPRDVATARASIEELEKQRQSPPRS